MTRSLVLKISLAVKNNLRLLVLLLVVAIYLLHNSRTDDTKNVLPNHTATAFAETSVDEPEQSIQVEMLEAMMELISHHIESKHRSEHLGEGWKGFMKDRTWEGNSHIGVKVPQLLDYVAEIQKFAFFLSRPFCICEVGLNGGHSAAAFLTAAGKETKFISFDIGNVGPVTYYDTVVSMLERVFPEQIEFIKGDSKETIPAFATQRGRVCDVISVDGDHSEEGAVMDLLAATTIARPGALLLMDDVNLAGPKVALQQVLNQGLMTKRRCVDETLLRVPREHRRSPGPARFMKQGWCFLIVEY
jgi:predicted O-methyltransferase YrrM